VIVSGRFFCALPIAVGDTMRLVVTHLCWNDVELGPVLLQVRN